MRRRVRAELERMIEEDRADPPAATAEAQPTTDSQPADSPYARVLALQRGAGNVATGRLLRMRAATPALMREPAAAAPGTAGAAAPPLDVQAITRRYFEQLRHEGGLLHSIIVPRILGRLAAPPRVGTRESLAELTLLARDELERHLQGSAQGPVRVVSPVEEIQSVVLAVARERNLIVPGHRAADDAGGLEREAKALAGLAGVKLPDFAIETSVAGFTFRFDGRLAASRKVGGADVSVKGGPGGVEGSARGGPVAVGAGVAKDSAKIDLKVGEGAVELKGRIEARAGQPTTWSAALEIKIGGGADPVPDPAKIAEAIEAAGKNVAEAAQYLGDAVAGSAPVSAATVEQRLKPAAESIGKVADYIQKNKARPGSGPRATVGVTASGSEAGGVSAGITLTITF